MKFTVYLVADAERDLLEIYHYVAQNDSVEKADRLLDHLEKTILKLETMPSRGHIPPELERIGVFEFREIFYQPYRITYQVMKAEVYVHLNVALKREIRVLPNLSNAGFSMFYG